MVWTTALDDFGGQFCGLGTYPIINSIYNILHTQPQRAPADDDDDDGDDEDVSDARGLRPTPDDTVLKELTDSGHRETHAIKELVLAGDEEETIVKRRYQSIFYGQREDRMNFDLETTGVKSFGSPPKAHHNDAGFTVFQFEQLEIDGDGVDN